MCVKSSSILVTTIFYGFFLLSTLTQAHQTETTKNDVLVPVLASAVGLLGGLVIAAVIFWLLKMKSQRKLSKNSQFIAIEIEKKRFSYPEVVKMTNHFERLIGEGGFGRVYYGILDDTPVAVMIYRDARHREFQTEANCLQRIHHRNLINLIGYCNEGTKPALIFEYMANGDLRTDLAGSTNSTILSWEQRLRIAIDVAKGLDYLHDGCKPPMIHRDVNSRNILISENLEATLSGFSLATSLPIDGASHVSTELAGTCGYLDPEYMISNRVTIKSDAYGFGVVLMELITSKTVWQLANVVEETYQNDISEWVSSMFAQGEVRAIVDQRLEGEYDIFSLEEALKIAMACVSQNSGDRPTMGRVVVKLNECLQMEITRLNE